MPLFSFLVPSHINFLIIELISFKIVFGDNATKLNKIVITAKMEEMQFFFLQEMDICWPNCPFNL